jgi:Zn-dependent protease with chaperone function
MAPLTRKGVFRFWTHYQVESLAREGKTRGLGAYNRIVDPHALEAARAVLPWWVRWGVVLQWAPAGLLASVLAMWASARVAMVPLRAATPASWVERARLVLPARAAVLFLTLYAPTVFAVFAAMSAGPFNSPGVAFTGVLVALPTLVAVFVVRGRIERALRGRPVRTIDLAAGSGAWLLVMAPHLIVAVAAVALESERFDRRTAVAFAVAAVGVAAVFAGGGVALARLLGLARPASERLARAVDLAARDTGVRPRGVFELRSTMANALALPTARTVLFTTEAMRVLDDDELAAIARHELGHVGESRGVVAVRVASAAVIVSVVLLFRPLAGWVAPSTGILGVLGTLLLALALLVLALRVALRPLARRMEERADAVAHHHDDDERVYARALARLYETNLTPAVLARRGVHPHLYDRLVAAGAPPPYPRPAPPSSRRLLGALLTGVGVIGAAVIVAELGWSTAAAGLRTREDDPQAIRMLIAVRGSAWEVGQLAYLEPDEKGEPPLLYAGCAAAEPDEVFCPANLAIVLATSGRCDEARAAARVASERADTSDSDDEKRVVVHAMEASDGCKPR